MRGCLDDLIKQTLFAQGLLEIVVIDSNSPENEEQIIREYIKTYPNIQYTRTAERETIYEAWNRGIRAAKGQYITNANTDDRHRADALEIMANALDFLPDIGLVYADCFVTDKENDTFTETNSTLRYDLPDFNLGTQLSSSCFGAQPMWKRSLHDTLGWFDGQWKIAGDYDFFIRVAWKAGAVHIRETLGLFLARNDSASGADNSLKTIQETLQILRKYRTEIPPEDLYPTLRESNRTPFTIAAVWWDIGNSCALSPYRDYELALQFYERALKTPGLSEAEHKVISQAFYNNAGVITYCLGNTDQAQEFLQNAGNKLQEAIYNRELLEKAISQDIQLYALHFKMIQFNHPVIAHARNAKGLMLTETGRFIWGAEHQQVFWDGYVGLDGVPVSAEERERAKVLLPRATSTHYPEHSRAEKPHTEKISKFEGEFHQKTGNKRILMTMYGWDDEGGGTLLPKTIAESLAQKGHTVAVVYASAKNIEGKPEYYVKKKEEHGITLFGIFNRPTLFYDLLRPDREMNDENIIGIFSGILDEFRPDVVHYHNFFNLSMSIASETKKRNIPSVFTSHNFWHICPRLYLLDGQGRRCSGPESNGRKCARCVENSSVEKLYSERLNYGIATLSDMVSLHLAPSSRAKELFISAGHNPRNIRVLRQASPVIDDIITHKSVRKQGVFRIGYLGALLPIKGVHVLVEAVQHLGNSISLHLYGNVPTQYATILKGIDTVGAVAFYGAYSYGQLPEILVELDVVVVPSLVEETGGLTAVEALAAGIPVVASRIGGLTDAVIHGKNGLLFEPGNVEELSAALHLLVNDKEYYQQLKNGAKPEKTFAEFIGELEGIYQEVIAD